MVLQRMRAGAQGIFAKILVALIVFVLAVFGFGAIDLFSVSEPIAATVNGDDITQRDLELETARQRSFQRGRLGENATDELLERLVSRDAVLAYLIDQQLLGQIADDLNLAIDQQTVQARLRRDRAGVDETTYRNWLVNQGYTPSSFQSEVAAVEIREQLNGGFRATAFVTEREAQRAARLQYQRRDIAWLLFDVGVLAADVEIEDGDIEAHYGTNVEDYMTETSFDFDLVRLPRTSLGEGVVIAEDTVAAAYEDEIVARVPRRHSAHILLEVNDQRSVEEATRQLDRIRTEIEAGADFAEKARQLSEDPGSATDGGDLGSVGKGVFAAAFEEALWALEPGQISAPVATEFGVHLIKLIDIEYPEIPTLAERRDEIVARLREEEVQRLFDQALRDIEEIAFEADSLTALVEYGSEYSLAIEPLDGVTRSSREDLLADRGVRDALFGDDVLLEGFNSRAVATADEVVVAQLRARHPATERPLEEVREDIHARLANERARGLAEDAAFDALTALAAGGSPASVADRSGVEWQRADGVQLGAGETHPAIVQTAFEMPAPASDERETEVATLPDGSRAVVVLSNVALADFGALLDAERDTITEGKQRLNAEQDYAALLGTLRSDASISAISFDVE